MRLLPKFFIHHGYTFEQIQREGDVALYEKSKGVSRSFEVILVQHREEQATPSASVMEAGEYYPRTSQWGHQGWSLANRERAEKEFADFVRRVEKLSANSL